jgi:hypothetical protein
LGCELTAGTRRCELRGIIDHKKRIRKEVIRKAENLEGNALVGAALHPASQCIQRLIGRLQALDVGHRAVRGASSFAQLFQLRQLKQ